MIDVRLAVLTYICTPLDSPIYYKVPREISVLFYSQKWRWQDCIPNDEIIGLPAPECLMVQELVEGGLKGVSGQLCYHFYETLR